MLVKPKFAWRGRNRYGASVTLTVTVLAATMPVTTGTVAFTNGTTSIGTGAVNGSGVATLSLTTLPVGSDSITASYGGTTNYAASTSNPSTVTVTYSQTTAAPNFSVPAGTYDSVQSVTLSDTTTGAVIHYTTDGTTPTSSSPTYSTAISVSVSETVQAIAITPGYNNSALASATYSLTYTRPDFTLAVAGGAGNSVTAQAGGSAAFTFTLTPANRFTTSPYVVTLAVTGLPTGATATFSPSSIPAMSGTTTDTLTIQLPQTTAANPAVNNLGGKLAGLSLALLLLPFAGKLRKMSKVLSRTVSLFLILSLSLAAVIGVSGCGVTVSSKTYTLTVTGTQNNMSSSATVTLSIK